VEGGRGSRVVGGGWGWIGGWAGAGAPRGVSGAGGTGVGAVWVDGRELCDRDGS